MREADMARRIEALETTSEVPKPTQTDLSGPLGATALRDAVAIPQDDAHTGGQVPDSTARSLGSMALRDAVAEPPEQDAHDG